jgi:hypothetical protein
LLRQPLLRHAGHQRQQQGCDRTKIVAGSLTPLMPPVFLQRDSILRTHTLTEKSHDLLQNSFGHTEHFSRRPASRSGCKFLGLQFDYPLQTPSSRLDFIYEIDTRTVPCDPNLLKPFPKTSEELSSSGDRNIGSLKSPRAAALGDLTDETPCRMPAEAPL